VSTSVVLCATPMRRDFVLVLLIAVAAFVIRTYPAWNAVFGDSGANFLETDAWYHVRLAENQVRNYPWRVTFDPYAAPHGQFVPIAPLFDTLTSSVVVLLHGREADTSQVERIAAFMPPLCGTLTVIAAWMLTARMFDRRAGVLAAALLAVLPGHFLDRTMLGFVDHHALEALLAMATLYAFVRGSEPRSLGAGIAAGVALGLYLLAWGSGAFLVAILGLWLMLYVVLAADPLPLRAAASTCGIAAVVALLLVFAFQDPRMHRYGSQVVALVGLTGLGLAVTLATRFARGPRNVAAAAAVVVVGGVAAAIMLLAARGLLAQILVDVARLAPNPARMGVLEARPLFLYSGEWRWAQPWLFFRTGFYVGAIALVPLAIRVWRLRRAADLLILVFTTGVFVATIGQNRFGYYLVAACAVVGGWLAATILDWGGVPHADDPTPTPRTRLPLAREAAVVAVAGGIFAPNLAPSLLLGERSGTVPAYWRDAMMWLRNDTPPAFLHATARGDDYYYARYPPVPAPPEYSVMNWWDQGYWIIQVARRVPVANPTQERAQISARFYAERDEARARALLDAERSRFVVADWELPFRQLADGTIMGRFQSVLDWAGGMHAEYYEILYRREGGQWTPVWIFHEPYYRSMTFRLSVLGGKAATPAGSSSVITVTDRTDASGFRFRELLTERTYPTYAAAQVAAASTPSARIVGLDPWVTAFPVESVRTLVEVHASRTPEQKPTEAPWVRIFAVK
jgi:oligosaccharyl transferase (archaeosortase A-associated)